ETVVAERPLLEAGDPNPVSGAAGSRVRAGERPVELDHLVLEDDIVHEHLDVRERGDERACDLRDLRGLTAVDRDRPARNEMVRNSRGIVAAPRIGVAAREVTHTSLIVFHHRVATKSSTRPVINAAAWS